MSESDIDSGNHAHLWREQGDGTLQCLLCHQGCRLKDGKIGICGVRQRSGMRLQSLVYGRVVAEHLDPIEKKPLYHVLPGSRTYSLATMGCNFRCRHCQNAGISQVAGNKAVERSGTFRPPQAIVAAALAGRCQSISYTYVEPTVFFEYAYDCSRLAVEAGLRNIFVSNGYMTREVIASLVPLLSAVNIDLKAFSDDFYRSVCGGTLRPVLDAIAQFRHRGIWVEVTTLLIPGLNDSDEELGKIAGFLAGIDVNIPWHVSGYHPAYLMHHPGPTPAVTLLRARTIGLDRGLHHVYTGNRLGCGGENTLCPQCRLVVITRRGFDITENRLAAGRCPACSCAIPGIWE
jgi:pyruvate formate lyase activating enzyme